uniref:(northern house mosquito) hypothetical protein n=1 Tax=Culex pipiens TaxID=7175 RepID=A0A8D8FL32_CULPI
MTTFNVTGHNNLIPGMVFTNVGIPTQFNVESDSRIDKSTHWISVMLTRDGNQKTVVKPCKFGPEGIHKQIPEHTYFSTDDQNIRYVWKKHLEEKANPPTIQFPITETMMLKFQCLNSCQGAKHARMVLIFRLHNAEQNVIAQSEVEIKVINNHTTKEKEAAKAKESNKGKRKGDHPECSVPGGTDLQLHINKKLKPGLEQILQETFEPAYAIAKTDKEREIIRKCIENCLNQIAVAEPVTTTDKVQAIQERRLSTYQGVQESGNKLCEIKLTMLEKMKDPLRQQVEALYAGSMVLADQSSCAMLRRMRDENIVSIEGATSLNCQPVPVMDDSITHSSTPFPVDRSMCPAATASGHDQGDAADQDTLVANNADNAEQCVNGDTAIKTYIIVPFVKVAKWIKDENNAIVHIMVLEEDTLIYIGDIENYPTMTTMPDTGLRNAEALPAFEGGIEDMMMEPDG